MIINYKDFTNYYNKHLTSFQNDINFILTSWGEDGEACTSEAYEDARLGALEYMLEDYIEELEKEAEEDERIFNRVWTGEVFAVYDP